MKLAASLFSRNSTAPASSVSLSPNLPIGVAARIFPVRAVGVPSAFHSNAAFCLVEKKPGTIHRAVTESDERSYCRYVFWISRSYFRRLRDNMPSLGYIAEQAETGHYIHHFSDYEYTSIQSKILRLIEEDKADRYGHDVFTDLVITDLLMTLSRLVYEQDHPHGREKETDTVQAIIEYIDQHLEEELSLETLGEQFYISKYYAAHEFKERTGISVHQYIIKKRLERCADEIKTGKSISRIYSDYGFQDYSSFFRAFKKEYNLSPKEYQKAYLHDPMYPGKRKD